MALRTFILSWLLPFALVPAAVMPRAGTAAEPPVYERATRDWRFPQSVADHAGGAGPAFTQPASGEVQAPLSTGWVFTPNQRVHPESTHQHFWPDIAVSPAGVVGVAWMADADDQFHIFYSQSADEGATWSPPEQIDDRTAGAYSSFPDLQFTPSGTPVVVWEDDRLGGANVYLSRRSPAEGGNPWTANVKVNTAGSPPHSSYFMNASLAVLDQARFFVAWTDWREGVFYQVYTRTTRNAGATWSAEARVSDEMGYQPVAANPCLVANPAMSQSGSETLYCVMDDWRGFAPGGRYPNAYFARSSDGGATWSAGVMVNDIEPWFQNVSSEALVRLPDNTLTCGWLNSGAGPSEFRTSVSTDGGATWGPSARASHDLTGGVGTWSSISSAEGWVFAGYDGVEGDANAYFRASEDGGRTWSEPAYRMDDDGNGGTPVANTVIAAYSPTTVYGAWEDGRPWPGPWLIYSTRATRSTTGVPDREPSDPTRAAEVRLVASPSPARPGELVAFSFAGGSMPDHSGTLRIFDIGGRVVRSLTLSAGHATWNGRDAAGRLVPAGLYCAWIMEDGKAASILIVR